MFNTFPTLDYTSQNFQTSFNNMNIIFFFTNSGVLFLVIQVCWIQKWQIIATHTDFALYLIYSL